VENESLALVIRTFAMNDTPCGQDANKSNTFIATTTADVQSSLTEVRINGVTQAFTATTTHTKESMGTSTLGGDTPALNEGDTQPGVIQRVLEATQQILLPMR
jgi:hypothetical protein